VGAIPPQPASQARSFRFPRSGETVAEEVDGPQQEIAIFLKAAKPVFYVSEALDLGYRQAECLNIGAPIEHGMVGKVSQHFDRNRDRRTVSPSCRLHLSDTRQTPSPRITQSSRPDWQ
jgi:hypothetical protein